MVPIFTKFFYPVLKFLESGTVQNLKSAVLYVSDYFNLSDEDCQEKIKSGR
ncbi:winged helix-turn-helix domain-containing protein, partial [Muribaculum intestinale]